VRRPVLLAALLGVLSVVLRRRSKAGQADKDVWTEATTAPDLR
jgi:hypothetical protein